MNKILAILCAIIGTPSIVHAMEPVLCYSADAKNVTQYVAVMGVPTQPNEYPMAKLFYGWQVPFKPEPTAQCEHPLKASPDSGILMHCWVQYGPDGGQGLVLRKNTKADGPKYTFTLTANGPEGPGAKDEMVCY